MISCSNNKGVYWCGDHPCINNKEKEAYFRKTMIVEVKNYNKGKSKNDSEIERLMNQAKLDEKKRIYNEKQIKKEAENEEKDLAKRIKIEEKKRIKEEKELAKQLKIDEKKRIKEEKKLAKQIKIDEKKRLKSKSKLKKVAKLDKKKLKKKDTLKIDTPTENIEVYSEKFNDLVNKIIKRNNSRPYPEINDIPK